MIKILKNRWVHLLLELLCVIATLYSTAWILILGFEFGVFLFWTMVALLIVSIAILGTILAAFMRRVSN